MPTLAKAYVAVSATSPLQPGTVERREPGEFEVQIAIKFTGICHSDIHTARGDWASVNYPVVVGHEIAGVVEAVGAKVTRHSVGDRVGVGCFVDSCRECVNCRAGEEQHCLVGSTSTYNSVGRDGLPTAGGYSTSIVVDEKYVLRIPDGIPLDAAAPLLCAGITMYSPLRTWDAGPGKRVAIIGMGGLGHMGVKIAAAMGAEVTVLSQSLKKQEDAIRLGAEHYYATSDPSTFEVLNGHFDLIVNTVSADIDTDEYLSLLALDGTMVLVGLPSKPLTHRAWSLASFRRSLAGSKMGGIGQTQEMLDFCAAHGLGAEVEVIPASKINDAYERVLASDVRYRFVIDAKTF
ncbi:putative zinc-type alcohol dehydrogenase-like protein [Arthrobacter sp. V4I6]|uniref:NAD(P)-dependent alcohol dehydrogenase n=1 Tax=unclassified Arthrobacter TaxID=235627 RepID=UPI00277D67D5|nr:MULTISPECIES: NAD(P)-dependent alcohol dehydrogenase [unclassified Arthrobacter]MDQ0821379.1 putative zinc-type alcohol dehydrogenase-like protein [Arthrobacter sp. V1I7]MDQ0855643.1 putative zinc-type alcohol dehydrogenase-like protein [Arthrobacter sp. V4I6]